MECPRASRHPELRCDDKGAPSEHENVTLFYYDQRIHLEGSDIAWIMNAAQPNTPVPAWTGEAALAGVPLEESRG